MRLCKHIHISVRRSVCVLEYVHFNICSHLSVYLSNSVDRSDSLFVCLFGWLVGFYGISTFVDYLRQIHFYVKSSISKILFIMSTQFTCQKNFYFKLFCLFKQF